MTRSSAPPRWLAAVAAGALAGFAGCGWIEWPPPGAGIRSAGPPPAAESDPRFVGASAVVVGRGDTVYAIARRHRLPVRAIIEANRLSPPYRLELGQRLDLPRGPRHVVQGGDTLYGISRAWGVDVYALARLNGIGEPYTIHVGQELTLPVVETDAPPPPAAATVAAVTEAPLPPAGQVADPPPGPASPPPAPAAPAAVSTPPAAAGGFLWPTRGRVVSRFGAKSKGLHNDGINIVAPLGAPVAAAENGVVAYAGNELRGFGNLLLIKHADGWVTAYAHNEELLVRRGEVVERGQVIAKVGRSGSVTTPQLHFELRRGKEAVDPARYLSGGRA